MKHIDFTPKGVCSRQISFDLDDEGRIHNLFFISGCPGNLRAISKLCENRNAKEVAELLEGNTCGTKSTSCADQLARAILQAVEENQ